MRVIQINAVNYGSTGRIMFQLADALQSEGHRTLCTSGFTWRKTDRDDFFLTSNIMEKTVHTWLARITGRIGCFSAFATHRLIKRLDKFQPDLIHLHNLHCWFLNLPMFFEYIRKHNIPVVWTFHDCWPFTGHCPHFQDIGCEKWKDGCHDCPLYRQYPKTFFDCSETMYRLKKQWFSQVGDMTIVSPSRWLADRVEESFLKQYPVQVIHNGIDMGTFQPIQSDVRRKHGIENKFVVLAVAYAWDRKKGLDVMIDLAARLGEDYSVVLVGTDDKVDQLLPKNVISVHRTENPKALAELYSTADVFVNPTREDNYPTVNMEALACGTPVITFRTGGSPEMLDDTCGIVVDKNDTAGMEKGIRRICCERPFSQEMCTAKAKSFDEKMCIDQYLMLYRSKL